MPKSDQHSAAGKAALSIQRPAVSQRRRNFFELKADGLTADSWNLTAES
jgi:hypothetical protein